MHTIEYFQYPENADKEKIQKVLDRRAEQMSDEEGCTGLEGKIRWLDKTFNSEKEAETWIEENERQWYDQLAVKFRDYGGVEDSKTASELKRKIEEAQSKAKEYEAEHDIQTAKAEYIGCPECGSKLKKIYLKKNRCPLCTTDLRSKTVLETLDRYAVRVNELRKKLKDEEEKQRKRQEKRAEVMWLVKIEYHT